MDQGYVTDLGFWVCLIMCFDHYFIMTLKVWETWSLLVVLQAVFKMCLIKSKVGFIFKKAIWLSFGAVEDIVNSISAGSRQYPNYLQKLYRQENKDNNYSLAELDKKGG